MEGSASPFLPAVSAHRAVWQWEEELTQVARPPCQNIVWFQGGFQCIRSLTFSLDSRLDPVICVLVWWSFTGAGFCQSAYNHILELHNKNTYCIIPIHCEVLLLPNLWTTEVVDAVCGCMDGRMNKQSKSLPPGEWMLCNILFLLVPCFSFFRNTFFNYFILTTFLVKLLLLSILYPYFQ